MALNVDEATGYPVVVSLHKATDFRRSVVIAVLTQKDVEDIRLALAADDLPSAMHQLFHDDIRSVLRRVFGVVPGLATALGKMNGEPFEDPGHYDLLLSLLTPSADPDHRKRTLALRHSSSVDSDLVTALARLDAALVHPILVKLIDGGATADTANAILRYVETLSSTPITTDDLLQISKAARSMNFPLWTAKLVARKADRLPAGPLEDHPAFLPMRDATQFASLGKQYQNCLSSHVMRAATGQAAFYLAKDNPDLIVELVRHRYAGKTLWALQGIHTIGNRRVPPRHRKDVEDLLRLREITDLTSGYDPRLSPELTSLLSSDPNVDQYF